MGNRDPAMLFYTSDFLTGAALLTMKERGQYITLLCLQQQLGHMRQRDMEKVVGKMSAALLAKFREDGEGKLYNLRAETEIEKRSAHCKLQRDKIIKRWADAGTTGELPLESGTETETVTERPTGDNGGDPGGAIRKYTENIEPRPSAARLDALRSFCASLSEEAVCHAVEVAADNNKKSWSYIKAILLRYTAQGIKTPEDIARDENRRRGCGSVSAETAPTDIEGLKRLAELV